MKKVGKENFAEVFMRNSPLYRARFVPVDALAVWFGDGCTPAMIEAALDRSEDRENLVGKSDAGVTGVWVLGILIVAYLLDPPVATEKRQRAHQMVIDWIEESKRGSRR